MVFIELGQMSTAMVTPFSITGNIDYDRTERLIEHLIGTGTDSIIVCGTTGESPTLSADEKNALIKFTVEKVNHKIPVIAGTGSNNTAETIQMTKNAEKMGANGVMLVTPYYNKPNQKGMYTHFSTIAKETNLPILLYNIPSRSVVNMTPETVINLSRIKNIRAVKEASGNLEQMAEIISGTDNGFSVYSGDDALTLPILAIGGKGIVSVCSHVVGNEIKQMIAAFNAGRNAEAAALHRLLIPIFQVMFSAPNPTPVKYALAKIGIETGCVRLPLVGFGEGQLHFDNVWETYKKNLSMIN